MRYYRIPFFLRALYPEAIFRLRGRGKRIYLTFDDGPVPGITGEIADICSGMGVEATFFFTGANAERNPDILTYIRNKGFGIGNHGFSHLNGWKTSPDNYLNDVIKGAEITRSHLFRPPYGALTPFQYRYLAGLYRIVMWDIMPYDFDRKLSDIQVINKTTSLSREGSVIVLHDQAGSRMPTLLGDLINRLMEAGFSFGNLGYELEGKD